MNILVTGASGHIGYHICKLLTRQGHSVRAFVRPASYQEHLRQLPLEISHGDILDKESLAAALRDIDAVFHAAAVYQLTPWKTDDLIITVAVNGTRNLFAAASKSSVKKIIYTSSVETIGLSHDKNTVLDETSSRAELFYAYSQAKIDSEQVALALAREHGIYTVVCNPATVIGPDDYKPTPSNQMLLQYARFNRFYLEAGQSLVDVEDVAAGHVAALERGRNGERYILSGENTEVKQLLLLIRKILKVRGPMIKLNKLLLYPAALVIQELSRLMNRDPVLTIARVKKAVGSYSYFDCSKAKTELGYAPRPLIETLPKTLIWLMNRHMPGRT